MLFLSSLKGPHRRIFFKNLSVLRLNSKYYLAHRHGVVTSIQTLNRVCRKLDESAGFVQDVIVGNGQMQGYRWLHP